MLWQQSWVITTETATWPIKLKIFIIWPSREKVFFNASQWLRSLYQTQKGRNMFVTLCSTTFLMGIWLPGHDIAKQNQLPPLCSCPRTRQKGCWWNKKTCFFKPVGVGEFLITRLFCSPLVAGKISTTTTCVRERIPVVLKQRRASWTCHAERRQSMGNKPTHTRQEVNCQRNGK